MHNLNQQYGMGIYPKPIVVVITNWIIISVTFKKEVKLKTCQT